MATLDFLYGSTKTPVHMGYQDDKNQLFGIFQLDAAITENHQLRSTITSNEIEATVDGQNKINDNVVHEPEELQITGLVSEAPISLVDAVRNIGSGVISNVSPKIGGATAFLSSVLLSDSEDRQQNALAQLLSLKNNNIPFTIVTGLRRYENMLIKSIVMPVDTKLGKSLRFTLDLVKVKIVESKTVLIPISKVTPAVGHTATSEQSLGKQKTTEATAKESERGSSLLTRFTGIGA